MYDSLEGLDYKPGECSLYVSQILKDIPKAKENGDLVEVPANEVQKGDVVVGGWSSHLVTDNDYVTRCTVTPQNARRDENGMILDPLVLIIKDATMRRLQRTLSIEEQGISSVKNLKLDEKDSN